MCFDVGVDKRLSSVKLNNVMRTNQDKGSVSKNGEFHITAEHMLLSGVGNAWNFVLIRYQVNKASIANSDADTVNVMIIE